MIIVRSPLRISLGGGGTDLKSYYSINEGHLIAAAINKYVYVSIIKPFKDGIYLKYSEIEKINSLNEIKHPIIRETLKKLNSTDLKIEITTLADIPSGTGLGSSGSFTTSLIKALYFYQKKHISDYELAKLACHIEIDLLKEPIGKQDQFISAYGGITSFTFCKNEEVKVTPLKLSEDIILELEDNLLLFFTGYSRSASSILLDQNVRSINSEKTIIQNLDYTKELGLKSSECIQKGDLDEFGRIMHEHWLFKQKRSKGMSNSNIDDWYNFALKNGAIGGKLVGAGGGGFLMFWAKDRNKLRKAMIKKGLEEIRFNFDFEGTKVVL